MRFSGISPPAPEHTRPANFEKEERTEPDREGQRYRRTAPAVTKRSSRTKNSIPLLRRLIKLKTGIQYLQGFQPLQNDRRGQKNSIPLLRRLRKMKIVWPCIRVNVLTRPPKSHGWNAPRHSAKLRSAPRSSRTTSATSSPREATRRPAINVQSRNATRAKPPTPALVPRTGYPSRGRPKRGGSGFTARGAAGLRGDDNAARTTARTTRRRHVGHSITARLFAPCSFVAPRPKIILTIYRF